MIHKMREWTEEWGPFNKHMFIICDTSNSSELFICSLNMWLQVQDRTCKLEETTYMANEVERWDTKLGSLKRVGHKTK